VLHVEHRFVANAVKIIKHLLNFQIFQQTRITKRILTSRYLHYSHADITPLIQAVSTRDVWTGEVYLHLDSRWVCSGSRLGRFKPNIYGGSLILWFLLMSSRVGPFAIIGGDALTCVLIC
jgi:hypothetical protein